MKYFKTVFLLIVIGILVAACLVSLKQKKISQAKAKFANASEFSLEDFAFTKWATTPQGNQRIFSLEGKKMNLRNKRFGIVEFALAKEILIKDVKVAFFDNNIPISYVTAKKAVPELPLNQHNHSMRAENLGFFEDVSFVTNDGRRLKSDYLRWNTEEDMIFPRKSGHFEELVLR